MGRARDPLRLDGVGERRWGGSLLTRDFAVGQLPAGRKGDTGAKGDPGATGEDGPAGPKGEPGATKAVARIGSAPDISTGKEGSLDIACEPGERATGGGAGFFGTPSLSDQLRSSFPVRLIRDAAGKPTGGIASVTNGGPAERLGGHRRQRRHPA